MRILIVEDSADWQKEATRAITGHEIVFASNFIEAVRVLLNKDKEHSIDGIICDLFFPFSATESRGKNGDRLIAFIEKHRMDPSFHKYHPNPPRTFAETGELYAPLGLHFLIYTAMAGARPFIFFAHGDRHVGAFGLVRFVMFEHLRLGWNHMFPNDGMKCDKSNGSGWREAVQMLDVRSQAKIWMNLALHAQVKNFFDHPFGMSLNVVNDALKVE